MRNNYFNPRLVFSLALFFFFVLFILISLNYSQTGNQDISESASTTAYIQNSKPIIENLFTSNISFSLINDFSNGINLTMGGTKTIYINSIISDSNGEDDIDHVSLSFYRSGVTDGKDCASDNNSCYKVNNCDINLGYGSGLEAKFSCKVDLQYYADATDSGGRYPEQNWVAEATLFDKSDNTNSASTTNEINTLLALNIPNIINYGTFNLGASTSVQNNQEMIITQKGNDIADVQVNGGNMNCTIGGYIPTANQKWSLTDIGFSESNAIHLTSDPVNTGLDILYRDNDNEERTKTIYWNIGIPQTGVAGVCSGTNTIIIVASVITGTLMDAKVINADYYLDGIFAGTTNANGQFVYDPTKTISLKANNVFLGEINGVNIPEDRLVFVSDLVGVSRNNTTDQRVINLARFIQSLDSDQDPSNGITITNEIKSNLNQNSNIQTVSTSTLASILTSVYPQRTLVSTSNAIAHLSTSIAEAQATSSIVISVDDETVGYGATTTIRWVGANIATGTCIASGDWSGNKTDSGTQITSTITGNRSYTITCDRPDGGTVTNTVSVIMSSDACILEESTFNCSLQ